MSGDTDVATSPPSISHERPRFWELLSPDDQSAYSQLQPKLSVLASKSRRSKNNAIFLEILGHLKSFIVRGEPSDVTRGLVCGILWLDSGIAINTHQLRLISSKCKSSINASFQALGYGTIPSGADVSRELLHAFPFMHAQFALLRQWTIRQKVDQSQPAMKLSEIVRKKCEERHQKTEDDITPPPDDDRWVNSYLNDECSLGDMVKALIGARTQKTPEAEKKEETEVAVLESDPLAFFSREWESDLFGQL